MISTGPQAISTIPPEALGTSSRGSVLPDGSHLRKPSWLDGFRRITTSGEFIPEIDGLRFIAIFAVLLHHASLFVNEYLTARGVTVREGLLRYGGHGVELFFVISGFILATPFALNAIQKTKPVKLKRYFLRRLTRLEPPYLLSILFFFILKHHFRPEEGTWLNLGLSSLYMNGLALGRQPQINLVAWSLEVEIQFYLIMPLLATVFWIGSKSIRRGCLVALALLLISFQPIRIHGFLTGQAYDGNILNYLQYFLAGLLLADIYATEWRGAPPPVSGRFLRWGDFVWLVGWPLLILLFASIDFVAAPGVTQSTFQTLLMICIRIAAPTVMLLLYFSLFYSVLARKLMRVQVITLIGGMCYSIYLMHNIFIESGTRVLIRWVPQHYTSALLVVIAVTFPLTLAACATFFRLIEKPCMRPDWPQRLAVWLRGKPTAGTNSM